jgi:hypothetical protein
MAGIKLSESVRGVWHMPHIATPSTMYFPRATRLLLFTDFVWLLACGRPLTLSAHKPTMITTHENGRRSRVLKPRKSIAYGGFDEESRSQVDPNPSQAELSFVYLSVLCG